jgi:hypothetical protein
MGKKKKAVAKGATDASVPPPVLQENAMVNYLLKHGGVVIEARRCRAVGLCENCLLLRGDGCFGGACVALML